MLRVLLREGPAATGVFALGVLPVLSIVWYGHCWATYILPFGWAASRARDAGQPPPGAAVAAVGWVLLFCLTYGIW
ncbi:MAG: hypothetical protein FJZ47_19050 [Candidatus Tectomicrobia bacterium]|uniref:Uncharacterized protein n=1 Tax=Tectimicrobiota bacterium TaxID=2528274 RepID=A0A937W2R5_UNCTE|nr:hypothetical protein [Candidatus Tectomicrobia bacterium]